MSKSESLGLQTAVFSLVTAAFATIYITQPVLPVLQQEFQVNESAASMTIAAVVLGISLANLPFGMLADKFPIRPIILMGGGVITACGLFCSLTHDLRWLIAARFIQGLFLPSLTTCLAAFLARSLPLERLNIVMGSYVSATVAGGLLGRLLGGWLHPPLHWRYAFFTASVLVAAAVMGSGKLLPREERVMKQAVRFDGFLDLLKRKDLLGAYSVAFGSFFVFSSVFNFLPFYLSGPPFHAKTEVITMLYLSYVVGVVVGPLAGGLSNRIGNGAAMVVGAVVFAAAIGLTLVHNFVAVALSLGLVCAGFFTVHASAAGLLNRRVQSMRGQANSLYVLFYYLGGYAGITAGGHVYMAAGWNGVAALGVAVLCIPLGAGIMEIRRSQNQDAAAGA